MTFYSEVNSPSVIQGAIRQVEASDKLPDVVVIPVENRSDPHHWRPAVVSGGEEAKGV